MFTEFIESTKQTKVLVPTANVILIQESNRVCIGIVGLTLYFAITDTYEEARAKLKKEVSTSGNVEYKINQHFGSDFDRNDPMFLTKEVEEAGIANSIGETNGN